jgi:hypothetical protein
MPKNITNMRSLFSLINQLSYCQSSSEELQPFHDLLSHSNPFYWDVTLNEALVHAKHEIYMNITEGMMIFNNRHAD